MESHMNDRSRLSRLCMTTGVLALIGAPMALASLPLNPSPRVPLMDQPDTPQPRDRNPDRNPSRDRDRDQDRNRDRENVPTDKDVQAKTIRASEITTAKQLLGAEVHSLTTNESIGKVADLIISTQTGDIEWLVIDKRGLFTHLVAVRMDQLEWQSSTKRFHTSFTSDQLDRLPTFKADEWANLRHESWMESLRNSITGDNENLGLIRYVRAKDIMGKALMVNESTTTTPPGNTAPRDPNNPDRDPRQNPDQRDRDRADRDDDSTTEVAKVHDIVLAMGIERAPVVIAQHGGFMRETVRKAVPINAVEWSERNPVILHMTESEYEALVPLPENFPADVIDPAPLVRAFESFKVRPLIRLASEQPGRW
jgi:uncharacterized protein YrrD